MKIQRLIYNHRDIEAHWRRAWESIGINTQDISGAPKPFYNLMMFPYPSAEGLHVGNMYAFTGSDVYGRFKAMQGFNVFEPIGLDGFGIHSENYALKVGRHPIEHAQMTQKNFYTQLHNIGSMYDWSRTLETYDPNYYRWTQWLFIQMFKHGLCYRGKAFVNWCPSCKTVLADEQVVKKANASEHQQNQEKLVGIPESVYVCERCGNIVEKKLMEQWFFRITAYAEKLLHNLRKLNWSDKVKKAQERWIGKKEGIEIKYQVLSDENKTIGYISCYTTRPDTNFGATFVAISPEHEFITQILKVIDNKQAVKISQYVNQAKRQILKPVVSGDRKKTGVYTGLYCLNELNGYKMPLYISDFVVEKVGTGAIVGVPGHDKRDYEFALTFRIPIIRVVTSSDNQNRPIESISQVQEDEGKMINSDFLNGLDIRDAKVKMMDYLVSKGWGKPVITYHLRDWIVSRQRYWGPPIPMIYCKKCADLGVSWFTTEEKNKIEMQNAKFKIKNKKQTESKSLEDWNSAGWYPVSENELPVILPRIEDYKPGSDGVAPLAKHKEFYEATCPECGSNAVRETDVSDTFLDSSWYFLRYPSLSDTFEEKFDKNLETNESAIFQKLANQSIQVPQENSAITLGRNSTLHLKNTKTLPWDPVITKKWLPVDMYTGGAEHSVLHLMYARFITMALCDFGYIDFVEPFTKFYAHGLVIKDGAKMSKSKGNIVNPDEYIDRYGTDALRLYLMFMGPFSQGGDFRDGAMEGMYRWVGRIWRLSHTTIEKPLADQNRETAKRMTKLVWMVSEDIEKRRYNTAIAHMMEFTNFIADTSKVLDLKSLSTFILLLAPFAPHLAEEIWQKIHKRGDIALTKSNSVHAQAWPQVSTRQHKEEQVDVVVQINGKLRAVLKVAYDVGGSEKEIVRLAFLDPKISKYLQAQPKKIIFVSRKVINFVI